MGGGYRIVYVDIDGTLMGPSGVVTPRTLDALRQAEARGCVVVICTGRNRTSAERVARQIGGRSWGIVLNGAQVVDWRTGEEVCRVPLPLDAARQAARVAHRLAQTPVCFGTRETDLPILADRRFPLYPSYAALNASRLVFVEDLETGLDAPPPSMAVYGTEETAREVARAWARDLRGVTACHGPTSRFACWYAQLTSDQADKARAAQVVADRLGVTRAQTLAIGDHDNDVPLLRWAGLGVCMADGNAAALACADHVTGTVDEEGVAQALERFVLA